MNQQIEIAIRIGSNQTAWVSADIIDQDDTRVFVNILAPSLSPKSAHQQSSTEPALPQKIPLGETHASKECKLWISRKAIRMPQKPSNRIALTTFAVGKKVEARRYLKRTGFTDYDTSSGYTWWPGRINGTWGRWFWVVFDFPEQCQFLLEADQICVPSQYSDIVDSNSLSSKEVSFETDGLLNTAILDFTPAKIFRSGLVILRYDTDVIFNANVPSSGNSSEFRLTPSDVIEWFRNLGFLVQPLSRRGKEGEKELSFEECLQIFVRQLTATAGSIDPSTIAGIVSLHTPDTFDLNTINSILESSLLGAFEIPSLLVLIPDQKRSKLPKSQMNRLSRMCGAVNCLDLDDYADFDNLMGRSLQKHFNKQITQTFNKP
ncbi:hypothetical protein HK098_002552 [Nowakowskiella sp. JEL0407]|nr:hypothetical protein HK098_002552 [Nowakowskiella sp. JEL0407]